MKKKYNWEKNKQEICLKKIYDEVTEDIFDMSNLRLLLQKLRRKKGDVYTLICLL